MSAEAVEPEVLGEVIQLFNPNGGLEYTDGLIQRRRELHVQIGQLGILLNDISQQHHDCINEIIKTNAALRNTGIDTDALARELQAEVRPSSAIAGYGEAD